MRGKHNPFYGEKHTDITRKNLSILATGRKHTMDTKDKIGKSSTERWLDIDYRKNMIQQVTGKNNPNSDKNIYTWYNLWTEETFTGNKYEFLDKYNLKNGVYRSALSTVGVENPLALAGGLNRPINLDS